MKFSTRGSFAIGLMVVVAVLASSVMPVDAGARVFVGVGVGVPFWYPYVYPYPAYAGGWMEVVPQAAPAAPPQGPPAR